MHSKLLNNRQTRFFHSSVNNNSSAVNFHAKINNSTEWRSRFWAAALPYLLITPTLFFVVIFTLLPLLHVADSLGSGAEFTIAAGPADAGQTVQDAATLLAADRGSRYAVYKVLDSTAATVSGSPALRQRYAWVDSGGLGPSAPQMKQGIDYIVIKGGRAVVVTLAVNPDKIQEVAPLFMRFVNSLSF